MHEKAIVQAYMAVQVYEDLPRRLFSRLGLTVLDGFGGASFFRYYKVHEYTRAIIRKLILELT